MRQLRTVTLDQESTLMAAAPLRFGSGLARVRPLQSNSMSSPVMTMGTPRFPARQYLPGAVICGLAEVTTVSQASAPALNIAADRARLESRMERMNILLRAPMKRRPHEARPS